MNQAYEDGRRANEFAKACREKYITDNMPKKKKPTKPNYINDKIKKVSEVDLKKALNELSEKHKQDRKEMGEAISQALVDGFRCGPKR